jgi:glycosyltransferase involved in cell wall biosynthesis
MRVGILVYGLDRPLTGIGRYILELTRALAALPEPMEIFLLTAGNPGLLAHRNDVHYIPLPGCRLLPGLLTLGSRLIPALIREHQLDIIHDPTGVAPFMFGTRQAYPVVTIHDVFPWSVPGYNSLLDTLIYRQWLPRVLRSRKIEIITVSDQSRQDIMKYLGVDGRRLQIIPYGIGPQFRLLPPDSVREHLAARFGISWPYILYVGALTQRKNIARALQAFSQIKNSFPALHFVLAGPQTWKQTRVESLVESLNIRNRVFLTGPLTDSDLPILYNGAELFIFPSLYEGFGLPPLEAMACGTPVITSNVSSLPEVTGEAALLVDPLDVEGIAQTMLRVLEDPSLAAEMRLKGLAQAAKFTWDRTARETLAVYQKVLERK